jgi:ribosome recycling factor
MALHINEAEAKLSAVVEHFSEELKKLRTGRAAASMLEGVRVEVYGQEMQLMHVATITVLDAQMLQITPFDTQNLAAISKAIREDQSLGLNPADDGRVVRVPIPAMTQERRQEVVKQIKAKLEEANVAMRNIRHDVINTAKNEEKAKTISEDEVQSIEKKVTDLLQKYRQIAEEHASSKEKEVMTV